MSILSLKDVRLSLDGNAGPVDILKGISLEVAKGESVGLTGASGSGKSSLLMVIGGLERATSGDVSGRVEAVGLGARGDHYPSQMSGGEQQRVALARAVVGRPEVLLADEPTGNLDAATGEMVMKLLFDLRDKYGSTLILVTHAPELAAKCDRVVQLSDGCVLSASAVAAQ